MRATHRLGTAVAIGALTAVAAVALVGGFERSAASVDSPGLDALLPTYPGAHLYTLGDQLAVNGVAVDIGYFSIANKSPRDITDYYIQFWGKHGLPTTVQVGEQSAQVAAFDDRQHLMRSVDVVRRGNRIVAFASIMPLDESGSAAPADLPLPPAAAVMQRATSNEQGRASESVSYVIDAQLGPARDAVVRAFTDAGWKLERERSQNELNGISLHVSKADRAALVTLIAERRSGLVGVQVHATSGLGDSP